MQRPDPGGTAGVRGQAARPRRHARRQRSSGIAIVFQELNLAPNLSIAENIVLGQEPRAGGRVRRPRAPCAEQARQVVRPPRHRRSTPTPASATSPSPSSSWSRSASSLVHEPRLLILDEPTSSLSEAETLVLFRVIADLKREGVTILYISHRMREVFALCDAVTVLRDGRHVRTMPLAGTDQDEIVRLMVGRDLASVQRVPPDAGGEARRAVGARPDPGAAIPRHLVRAAPRRDRRPRRPGRRRAVRDGARRVRRARRRTQARSWLNGSRLAGGPAAHRHAQRHRPGAGGPQGPGPRADASASASTCPWPHCGACPRPA